MAFVFAVVGVACSAFGLALVLDLGGAVGWWIRLTDRPGWSGRERPSLSPARVTVTGCCALVLGVMFLLGAGAAAQQ